jgi:hypothetical protein
VALDSNRAARWTYDTLKADVTLGALLGAAGNVFRRVALRDTVPPAVVVEVYSTQVPIGAILTGHDTHTATPVMVSTAIWDVDNNDKIEQIADRICVLLDGAKNQAVAGGGVVISCIKATDHPRDFEQGDASFVGWEILWDIDVKA